MQSTTVGSNKKIVKLDASLLPDVTGPSAANAAGCGSAAALPSKGLTVGAAVGEGERY